MPTVLEQIDVYFVELAKNEYVNPALTLFLILYAALIAPKLSEKMARLFDVPLFNLLLFFLTVYTAKHSPAIAIIAAIGILVSMITLNNYKVDRKMMAMVAAQDAVDSVPATMPSVPAAMEPEMIEGMEAAEAEAEAEAEMEMEASQEQNISEAALIALPADAGVVDVSDTCTKRADFRNSFYPQYVNMKPDAYRARYSGGSVAGFDGYDSAAAYASI